MDGVVGDNLSREELLTLVGELRQQNAALLRRVAELEREVSQLRSQLAAALKNSSTSSKPPSSDIVKPPKNGGSSGPGGGGGTGEPRRRIGGQPNHPKHERPAFRPDQVDRIRTHTRKRCPDCGGRLRPGREPPRVVQQVELVARPVRVTEHRVPGCWCARCGVTHFASLPPDVAAGGLLGPRLTTLVAYLKSACHASFSTIRTFLRDCVGLTVSRGYLAKVIRKVAHLLREPYNDLLRRLPRQKSVRADETGHPENKRRLWTWCFRAKRFTLFHVAESRGADVLFDVLGRMFRGVLSCDYYSAYRKYMKDADIRVQFCLAHLIRELKYLTTLPDGPTRDYGERLLAGMRQLFGIIHRRETMSERRFIEALADQRERILQEAQTAVPPTREARNLAMRLQRHGEAYFEFITTPHIEPTNNLAEQAIRFVVIDRRITQGTRGPAGRRWCERIWTVLATCAQQHRSAFDYIHAAVRAFFQHQPAPMLLNDTS